MIIGWVLIALGIVLFPLPIPLGIILLVPGFALVVAESRFLQRLVRVWRRRYPGLDARIHGIRPRMPAFVRKIIDVTDPRRRSRKTPPPETGSNFQGAE